MVLSFQRLKLVLSLRFEPDIPLQRTLKQLICLQNQQIQEPLLGLLVLLLDNLAPSVYYDLRPIDTRRMSISSIRNSLLFSRVLQFMPFVAEPRIKEAEVSQGFPREASVEVDSLAH